jgi:hypothetical protein
LLLHADEGKDHEFIIPFFIAPPAIVLYKTLQYAHNKGIPYFKIMEFDFKGAGYHFTGDCQYESLAGKTVEYRDRFSAIELDDFKAESLGIPTPNPTFEIYAKLRAFDQNPNDSYVIDTEATYSAMFENED